MSYLRVAECLVAIKHQNPWWSNTIRTALTGLGMNVRAYWRPSFQLSAHDATSYVHNIKKRVHILPGV
jgi:hypothetical protein